MTPDTRPVDGESGGGERGDPTRFDDWVHRWLEATTGVVALTALAIGVIAVAWQPARTVAFTGGVALTLAAVVVVIGIAVERSARRGVLDPLTVASWVTLTRGALLACFVGVLGGIVGVPGGGTGTLPAHGGNTVSGLVAWLPAALFAAAGLLDAVDGMIARTTGAVTDLGGRLDAELDGFSTLVGAVAVVSMGAASVAFLAVGVAWYLYAGSRWWRRRRGRPVRDLPTSRVRAPLSAAVLVAIWLGLTPVTTAEQSTLLTTVVAVPFLVNFLWDWLVMTRRVSR